MSIPLVMAILNMVRSPMPPTYIPLLNTSIFLVVEVNAHLNNAETACNAQQKHQPRTK